MQPVPAPQDTTVANERGALNAATVRTAVPTTWTLLIIYGVFKLTGKQLDIEEVDGWVVLLAPAVGVIVGIGYRLFREIERRWPAFGRVFLGSSKSPVGYVPTNVAAEVGQALKPQLVTETAAAEAGLLPPAV